jgi:hypothetical protein
MTITRTFYRQTAAQAERGNHTDILTIEGEPDAGNFFELYLHHAASFNCYTLYENGAYIAVQFRGVYIVRAYLEDAPGGVFSIRYLTKDFRHTPLMDRAELSRGKLKNIVSTAADLHLAEQMLTDKAEAR